MINYPRIPILGVQISAIHMQQAIDAFAEWIRTRSSHYVCVTPLHAVMECVDDPTLLPVFNQSGLTTPDGMGVVYLLRMRGCKNVSRVYGPDLMLAACQAGLEPGWRHYFYGGAPGVTEKLTTVLQTRFPGIIIAGCDSPPFRPLTAEEDQSAIERIRTARADIVWVGIGSPRQERWMAEHVSSLNVPVLAGVGAAFDFHAGVKPQAPRWVQRTGLEWLFRLFSEPRRLWKRYLLGYPRFLFLYCKETVQYKWKGKE